MHAESQDGLQITVLGWSAGISSVDAAQAGYLVHTPSTTIMVDCGSGTIAKLQSHREMTDLDALLLSHLHSDHIADALELVVHRRYHPVWDEPDYERQLPTWAPAEAPERLAMAYAPTAADRETEDVRDVFGFRVLTDGARFTIGDIEVEAIRTQHSIECYGFRFSSGGRTLGFTADSGPCEALLRLADGVDLLVSEATWDHGERAGTLPTTSHLSGRQAGEHARDAGAKRLLLTHLEQWTSHEPILAEAREAYGPGVEIVETSRTYAV